MAFEYGGPDESGQGTGPDQDSGMGAARVGANLRSARLRLGWELPEIAAALRIRLPYLEALEQGRVADLPGNAYAMGFLRTYSTALGLDPEDMTRRFRSEATEVNRKTKLAFPAPVPERGVPAGALVLLGVLLAIGAYIGWYRLSGNATHYDEQVAAVPERLAPLASTVPPAGVAPSTAIPAAPAVPAASPAAPADGGLAFQGKAVTQATPVIAPPTALPTPPTPPLTPPPTPPKPTPVAPPAPPPAPVYAADAQRITLRATADTWIQVRDRGGQVLLNRVLRSGESWPVPGAKVPLLLTTGNAAGTQLLVDGVLTAPLGAQNVVRRDLPLDADSLKAGKSPNAGPAASTGRPVTQ